MADEITLNGTISPINLTGSLASSTNLKAELDASFGVVQDCYVKISATDTTEGFLQQKLTAGTNISLTKLNTGSNEILEISASLEPENLWDRDGTTLSPHNAGDNVFGTNFVSDQMRTNNYLGIQTSLDGVTWDNTFFFNTWASIGDPTHWYYTTDTPYNSSTMGGGIVFVSRDGLTVWGGIDGLTGQLNWEKETQIKANLFISNDANLIFTDANLNQRGNLYAEDTNYMKTDNNLNVAGGLLKCGANSASVSGYGITSAFGGGLVIDGCDDNYGRGGAMFSTRRNTGLEPFMIFTGYDIDNPWESSGQTRQLWYGGVGFGVPDANEHLFFTANTYSEDSFSTDTPLVFRIVRNKIWIGEHNYLPTYTLDPALPRYKFDFGDGDFRIRNSDKLGFGGNISSDYESYLYDNGTYFHIYSNKSIAMNQNIQIPSDKAYVVGDENTDGSWRMALNGDDLEFQRRESGSWVAKGSYSP